MTTKPSTSKVAVSIDVEDWYHGPSVMPPGDSGAALRRFLDAHPDAERGYRYIDACLEMLEIRGIKATFFWVAEYARRHPELLRRVAAAGHEIGCHGLTHAAKLDARAKRPLFTPAAFADRTAQARAILQELCGRAVIGYRAPNAYLSGAMLDVLEELGFRYDSSVSVNSLYNKTDGRLTGVTTRPYYPARGGLGLGNVRRGLIEFPWPYLNLCGFKMQAAGGPFLRLFGSTLIRRGLAQSLRRGHTVFYFHPIDICNEDFPFKFSLKRPFLWYIKGDRVKRRVERVLDFIRDRAVNFESLLRDPEVVS